MKMSVKVDGSGVTQPVSGTVAISGGVGVSGTVAVTNFPATQPVSAAALPLPANAATDASVLSLLDSDYATDLSLGRIPGRIFVPKFGRNTAVVAGADIWGALTTWVPPTSAGKVSFVSTSVLDVAAGTGARTVYVEGLDGSYAMVSETITLNGLTPVLTANSYFIVHRAMILTAGALGIQQGTITGTSAGGGTPVLAVIVPAAGQTTNATHQIPAGYTGLFWRSTISAQFGSQANPTTDVAIVVKPFGGVWLQKVVLNLSNYQAALSHALEAPLVLPEKTIIKATVLNVSTASSFDVGITYGLTLVSNS